MPADECRSRLLHQCKGDLLIEWSSLWTQQYNRPTLVDCLNCCKNWLRFHNHAGAASIRVVIDNVMLVGSGVADIMQGDAEQPALLSAFQHACRKWPLEHFREQVENIELHGHLHLCHSSSNRRRTIG